MRDDLKNGDQVIIIETSERGKIITRWGETFWVQTTSGKTKCVKLNCLRKHLELPPMKIKSYKMAIIPFEHVPHNTIFRYNGDWYKRIVGTTQQAEKFVVAEDDYSRGWTKVQSPTTDKIFIIIATNELVALSKSTLERTLSHAYIVDEFDLENRND